MFHGNSLQIILCGLMLALGFLEALSMLFGLLFFYAKPFLVFFYASNGLDEIFFILPVCF